MKRSTLLAWTVALAPMVFAATAASAQDEVVLAEATTVDALVVTGDIAFRDRTNDANPVLSYDLDYFQRFEPVSVGEMLKRVPGVTFTSDVLEFDGVSMRGMPPGYTQVLINGRRAPGGESDRSFFVDRIPAEIVERIEIIRSPRADQPSEGMAGSLNIILKEGATLRGGFAKAGALINEDGEIRPSAAIAYAGGDEAFSWWGALNYQGRRNPKKKQSWRYEGDPLELDNIEYQDDTRDGVDISGNTELTWRFDGGRLRVGGLAVDTDRDEDETSLEYAADGEFNGAEIQAERISQQTYSLTADAEFEVGPGELDLKLGWSAYNEDTGATVWEAEEEDLSDREIDEHVQLEIEDREFEAGAAYTVGAGAWKVKGGADVLRKTRDGSELEHVIEDDGSIGGPDEPDEQAPGSVYSIEETRIDPFVRFTFEPSSAFTADLGLRLETTDRDVTSDLGTVSYDAEEWNPSAHFTWRVTDDDQFRVSLARTVRRPDYDFLKPFIAIEEPADENALQGNPGLENETAWGLDAGYERRFGPQSIFGVNFFYREVSDVIDVVGTGLFVDEDGQIVDPDEVGEDEDIFSLYQPLNIGDGKAWGFEVDLSTPLTALGLPDTGVFFNYTWMDSEVTDPVLGIDKPFTNQPQNVYNVGFIHTVRPWGMSFGASLYDRDMGFEHAVDEDVTVDYDADLEAFVEKRIGERVVVRLAGMNLLDKEKRETFRKYDGDSIDEILEARADGDVDEFEVESERSGALYQVTVRVAF